MTLLLGILLLGWSAWALIRQNGPAAPAQAAPLPSASPALPMGSPTLSIDGPTLSADMRLATDIGYFCAPRARTNPLDATECAQFWKNRATQEINRAVTAAAASPLSMVQPTHVPQFFLQRPAGAGRLIRESDFTVAPEVSFGNWIVKTADSYQVFMAGYNVLKHDYNMIIQERTLDGFHLLFPHRDISYYPLPIQGQDFTIVDVVGETLLLRTTGGSIFAFDAASRQYVSPDPYQPIRRAIGGGTLVEDGAVPFTRPGYTGWSRWSTRQPDGQTLTVYAGADQFDGKKINSGKLALAVVTSQGEPGANDTVQFYQPNFENVKYELDDGLFDIFDVSGSQILLQSHKNALVFDLSSRNFIYPISPDGPNPLRFTNFNSDFVELDINYDNIFNPTFLSTSTATPVTPSPASAPTLDSATPATAALASPSATSLPSSTVTATPGASSSALPTESAPTPALRPFGIGATPSPSSLPSVTATDALQPPSPTTASALRAGSVPTIGASVTPRN